VEKERFNYLVRNYSSLTQQETAELRAEQDQYSYCQLIRNLIARGDQDNQTEMKDMSLTVAAVYSTDRSVLKQILSEPRLQRQEGSSTLVTKQEIPPPPPTIVEEVKTEPVQATENKIVVEQSVVTKPEEKKETKVVAPPVQSDPAFDPDQALSKFMADLGPMREMKLKFEKAMEEFQKNLAHTPVAEPEKPVEKQKRKPRASKSNTENLLDEIKTTKKKVVPESPKQIEQIEIIDQFIKAKPGMPKADKPIQTELDLTSDTDTYNENVVSETLALILIKQGKKEKAIEVLRKLIWKFPQKKAYFAAQIEDLTK
jgi:tetratricopeptide (TPR) repeat protein